MKHNQSMNCIAHIETVYKTKFGVPRQAGLVDVPSRIVFEPEYRVAEAVRGLEEFEYVWLIWGFHLAEREQWRPTVRPPRLGGNTRVGVFATRSPFRPNPIGLSSVRLLGVDVEQGLGPVLTVCGADLVDGTPIYDIKPYIAYADSHPNARCGFAQDAPMQLEVEDPGGMLEGLPLEMRSNLITTISQDPRPHYQNDPLRIYAMLFGEWEVRFRVDGARAIIVAITAAGNPPSHAERND